jgi:hypothetical protein
MYNLKVFVVGWGLGLSHVHAITLINRCNTENEKC